MTVQFNSMFFSSISGWRLVFGILQSAKEKGKFQLGISRFGTQVSGRSFPLPRKKSNFIAHLSELCRGQHKNTENKCLSLANDDESKVCSGAIQQRRWAFLLCKKKTFSSTSLDPILSFANNSVDIYHFLHNWNDSELKLANEWKNQNKAMTKFFIPTSGFVITWHCFDQSQARYQFNRLNYCLKIIFSIGVLF